MGAGLEAHEARRIAGRFLHDRAEEGLLLLDREDRVAAALTEEHRHLALEGRAVRRKLSSHSEPSSSRPESLAATVLSAASFQHRAPPIDPQATKIRAPGDFSA